MVTAWAMDKDKGGFQSAAPLVEKVMETGSRWHFYRSGTMIEHKIMVDIPR
jgi:hypothetical protein